LKMMADESDESECINESFMCCVCLELLYKPVILACGHMSCFWCVHKSMSSLQKSHCPLCRSQYYHFPYVCEMLHLLLLKLYPVSYRRRESQTLELEKETGLFSQKIDGPCHHSKTDTPEVDECISGAGNTLEIIDRGIGGGPNEDSVNDGSEKVSVNDLLCCSCGKMLFQPAVLNCGHVFCSCCIPWRDGVLKCEVCQSPHPGPIPKVCLELDQFLMGTYPREYEARRAGAWMKQQEGGILNLSEQSSTRSAGPGGGEASVLAGDSIVHIRVGCDLCGMYPIIGERYKCKDCVEKIGFDLCKDCYKSRSKLPGRFSQQHRWGEHRLEMVKS
ncbi:hypothetical protein M569_04044, partial [Genlisea aurea]